VWKVPALDGLTSKFLGTIEVRLKWLKSGLKVFMHGIRQKLLGTVEVRFKWLKSGLHFFMHGNCEWLKSTLQSTISIPTAFNRSSTATLPDKSEATALRPWAYICELSFARPSKGDPFF